MDKLREKTVVGSFWVLFERFGYLTIQFLSNLVFARLLMPDDFGVIGILLVFTSLSAVLVDGGLASALVQKKNLDEADASTMFVTNMVLSILVFLLILCTAPFIASFFKNPDLAQYLRVIEVIVIINAFAAVQSSMLSRSMEFGLLAKYKIISIIVAVAVALVCILLGMGVWALVIQNIVYSIVRASLLWGRSEWKPQIQFSKQSFNALFGYGSKLLVAKFISELYVNFQSILIGRKFLAQDLGFYTQAKQLQQVPVQSLSYMVNSVSFPAFSQLQDKKEVLLQMIRQNLKGLVFINTPLMFFISVVASPLLIFLYSEKWIQSVPYLRFLCIGFGVLLIIHQCTLTSLRALGRSDYVLKLEIIKKILGISLLLGCTQIWGIWGIMIGLTINSVIEVFLNGYYLKKEIGYGALGQIKDFLPSLFMSLVASLATFLLLTFAIPGWSCIMQSLLCFLCFAGIYLGLAYLFKVDALFMYMKIVDRFVMPKLHRITSNSRQPDTKDNV